MSVRIMVGEVRSRSNTFSRWEQGFGGRPASWNLWGRG